MKCHSSASLRGARFLLNPPTYEWVKISRLLASVGLRPRKLSRLRRALLASTDVLVVYSGQDVVGFGRMVSDGAYYGTIWDVAVRADLQGRGIGTMLVRRLLGRARTRKLYMVGLFTAMGNRAFYENLGFTWFHDIHAMTLQINCK